MSKGNYLVFHIVGYDMPKGDDFVGKIVVRLIDSDLESAMERAKKIIEKPFWFLAEVVEYKEGK